MSSNDNLKKLSDELNSLIFAVGLELAEKPLPPPAPVVPTFSTFEDIDRYAVHMFREQYRVPSSLAVSRETYSNLMQEMYVRNPWATGFDERRGLVANTSVGPISIYVMDQPRLDNITFSWSFDNGRRGSDLFEDAQPDPFFRF